MIYSDGSAHFVQAVSIAGRRRLHVALRAPRDSGITSAYVRTAPDGETETRSLRRQADGPWERWEGQLTLRGPWLRYSFIVERAGRLQHLDQRGLHDVPPGTEAEFVHLEDPPPAWLAGRTFYEIFPDRFARGRSSPAVPDLLPWGAPPPSYRQGGEHAYLGGDLAGIRERIDYLRDLGVGGLYLTPIFLANSNHRYDVWDHHRIDPRLGDEQQFAALCRDLHEADVRIVLDGVFNHVGDGHPWFNRGAVHDVAGAWQDPRSAFAEFFIFHRHPERYESWCGHAGLPKLDYRSQRLRDVIYRDADAIVRRWLRPPYGIDGWRLDAVNTLGRCGAVQVQPEVVRQLREAVRQTRPDAYLLGEVFGDPTALIQGDQLDGVMAYHGFYFPVLRWLTAREPEQPRGLATPPVTDDAAVLAGSLVGTLARAPFASGQAQLTLLGSHDTVRILTALGDDRAALRLAFALLLTWPGVPCVYYGDEIGSLGGRDPENRACMPWDTSRWDRELRDHVRSLIALRRRTPELAQGGVRVLHASGPVFVFARILGPSAVVVALNRGHEPVRVTVPVRGLGLLHGEAAGLLGCEGASIMDGELALELAPQSACAVRLQP